MPSLNNTKLCQCGCGNHAPIAKNTRGDRGYVKGQSLRFIRGHETKKYNGPEKELLETWKGMKSRCFYTKNKAYHRYGGRGITICNEWISSLKQFYLDMGPRPTPKHTIDRINNDGNYEPGNCKWSTQKEQAKNKAIIKLSNNDVIEIRLNKNKQTAKELANKFKVSLGYIYQIKRHDYR